MKRIIIILIVIFLVGCKKEIRNIEGIDMNKGILVDSVDTRGWFNDGEVCEQYDFSLHPIQSLPYNYIPIDEVFERLINDYIHDELFDEVKEGYYYIIDRQNKDNDIFERPSMNIEMIVYDTQNNQLYYILLNT